MNLVAALLIVFLLAACGSHPDHDAQGAHAEKEYAHEEEQLEAANSHDTRIVPHEAAQALGLSFANADLRTIESGVVLNAFVFSRQEDGSARATAHVSEEIASRLKTGQQGEVKGTGTNSPAVITNIQRRGGQAEVLIEFSDAKAIADVVEVRFETQRDGQVVSVPKTAVLTSVRGTFVFRAEGDTIVRTAVTTGRSDDTYVEILEGLAAGDRVVASPVKKVWLAHLHAERGGEGHGHAH